MRHGRFDADTAALEARIRAHEEFGAADLNQWVFDHLDLAEGQHVLDIGCGTGKQTLPMAEQVATGGRVVAVDISEEAVAAVREGARAAGLHGGSPVTRCRSRSKEGSPVTRCRSRSKACNPLPKPQQRRKG